MVGDLTGAHHDLVAEEVDIIHEAKHSVIAESQGASRSKLTLTLFHKSHHGILDYLGIHFEARDIGVFAQSIEHSVSDITYTRLDGEELLGEFASLHFASEELADVLTDASCQLIGGGEGGDALRGVGGHDTNDLLGVDPKVCNCRGIRGKNCDNKSYTR